MTGENVTTPKEINTGPKRSPSQERNDLLRLLANDPPPERPKTEQEIREAFIMPSSTKKPADIQRLIASENPSGSSSPSQQLGESSMTGNTKEPTIGESSTAGKRNRDADLNEYFGKLGKMIKTNDQRMQKDNQKAIRTDIINSGKGETHKKWVVEPAKAFLESNYGNVGAMNEAFKPILNTYKTQLHFLIENFDKESEQISDPHEKSEAVKRYDAKKLDLDEEHILGLVNALEKLKNEKNDEKSSKFKADVIERIKVKGIDKVYEEAVESVRQNRLEPAKEEKRNETLNIIKSDYEKGIKHLNESEEGRAASEFRQDPGAHEASEAVKLYEERKSFLDVKYISSVLKLSNPIFLE